MIFKLVSTGDHYCVDYADKYERLGFKFAYKDNSKYCAKVKNDELKIQINTLEELMLLSKIFGNIMVYDDTLEIKDDHD